MFKSVIVIIGLLLFVSSVSAVVYPQEYYDLKNQSDNVFSVINISNNSVFHNTDSATYATVLELRRQNILLEKQNSLLEEQVKAQWVGNCYVSNGGSVLKRNEWIDACAAAVYPVR